MKRGNLNRQVFAHNSRDSRMPKQPIPVKVVKVLPVGRAARQS
jgi:hypothetical protein